MCEAFPYGDINLDSDLLLVLHHYEIVTDESIVPGLKIYAYVSSYHLLRNKMQFPAIRCSTGVYLLFSTKQLAIHHQPFDFNQVRQTVGNTHWCVF